MNDSESTTRNVAIRSMQGCCSIDNARLEDRTVRVLDFLGVRSFEILILFVDDPTIAQLNLRHLNHEGPTDIITFPVSEPGDDHLEGELVISAPWAARVAAENGDDPFDEILLYVVHGILHLTGQDDLSERDAAIMKRREFDVLNSIDATVPKGRFDLPGLPDSGN